MVSSGLASTFHFLSCEGYYVSQIIKPIRHFMTSEDGPAAVEYAVMLSLILVACLQIVAASARA